MNVNGIPEQLDASNGMMIAPSDAIEFKGALEKLLAGNVSYDNEKIARDALSKYSPETIGAQIMNVYNSILGES